MSCYFNALALHLPVFCKKTAFSALAVLTIIVGASAQATDNNDIRRLINQGNLPAALSAANGIIKDKPQDANARFLKGVILTQMQQNAEAIQTFTALTQDFPEFPEPWNNLAVLHARNGDLEQAKGALQMAIRTQPGYAVPYENLGDTYLRLAIQNYQQASKLDPKNNGAKVRLDLTQTLLNYVTSSENPVNPLNALFPPATAKPPAPPPNATQSGSPEASPTTDRPKTTTDQQPPAHSTTSP